MRLYFTSRSPAVGGKSVFTPAAADWPALICADSVSWKLHRRSRYIHILHMSQATRSMRSGPSRHTRADALITRPAAVHVPEQGSSSQTGRSTVLLRRSSSGLTDNSLVMDNKNPSKLVVKPDGNIMWEIPSEPNEVRRMGGGLLRGAAELALVLSAASSGVMGIAVAVLELKRAAEHNYCVTSQHLAKMMAMTVSSSFAGMVAGLTYAPLLATRLVCGRFAKPAALAGAIWAATRGALRFIALRGLAPANLLARLEEAALNLGSGCLAVAQQVAERAAASPRFRRAFVKLGGVQMLLRLLRNGLDGDSVKAIMQALAELLRDQDGRDALVANGGVPLLVHGLEHPDDDVTTYCSEMLARLAGNSAAQEAIRGAGGIPLVVQLLSKSASVTQQVHLLTLVSSLANSSEETSNDLERAGVDAVLLQLITSGTAPHTQVKAAAITALHSLCSASPSHLSALRAVPGATEQLIAVAAAYQGSWFTSKAALSALNAQLAAAEEAEARAAAPIAGEAPEMVDLP